MIFSLHALAMQYTLLNDGSPTGPRFSWLGKICLFWALCFSALYAPARAQEKPVLNWAVFEQAPYFIRRGALKDQGVGDFIVRTYMDLLPGIDHKILYMSNSRYAMALQNENVCVPVAWSHAEEAHLMHSRPHTIEPPMGLLARIDVTLPQTKSGSYSLQRIMTDTDLRLLAYKSFTYGLKATRIVAQFDASDRVLYQGGELLEVNVQLLDRRRADIALALPGQMSDLRAQGKSAEYRFYEIDEIANYVRLMSHCSAGNVAQSAMQVINAQLTDQFLEEVLRRYLEWYPNHDNFEALYRAHIIEGKNLPNIGDYFEAQPG